MSDFCENEIIHADARDLAMYVEPDSVSLTVTSPPYRNAINYSMHVENMKSSKDEWVRGTGEETTDSYLSAMQQVFRQVFVATKPGGLCCIVVGDEVVNGKLIPLPSLLLSRLANLENEDEPDRWRLRDVIIWHKVTSGRNGSGNRFGQFVLHPRPGYFRVNIMHEYILILQKGRAVAGAMGYGEIPLNRIVKRELANSIWNIPPVPPRSVNHPVPFPEQIPWRLITLFTTRGDMVLDPMNGSGQTTKVACAMGRRYLGFDVKAEYVMEARRRLEQAPKLSDYLIPVYHKESWSKDVQTGFFETTEVDLSSNVPGGYKLFFTVGPDAVAAGSKAVVRQSAASTEDSVRRRELYLYYKSLDSGYICFIIYTAGRQYRLNLGRIDDPASLLHRAAIALPVGPFAVADLGDVVRTSMIRWRLAARACIDVLLHDGYVRHNDGKASTMLYELTPAGRQMQMDAVRS